MKKNNFIWFSPHVPKLSIGFKKKLNFDTRLSMFYDDVQMER